MPDFRFVHTADIHLDSPLKGLTGQEGGAAERIRGATREAFDLLVGRTIEEEASFILIVGDLYDGDWRDYNTGLFFVRQMGRLAAAGIPAFVLYGNHDAESQITRRLVLPENVKVFPSRKAVTMEIKELNVALHGQSYRQRDVTENLAHSYPFPPFDKFNIGLLHTGLGGMGGHADYAPCTLNDLVNKGYDYWALGHVHQRAVLHERPHVVFPGNLQGRHIGEAGPKGASLVTVEDGAVADITPIHTDVVRWSRVPVTVADCIRTADVTDRVGTAIADAVSREGDGRLLACRIELQGRTELHDRLLSSGEQLLADARASALSLGESAAWIERVVVSTEPVEDSVSRADALGELQRLLTDGSSDPDLVQRLQTEIGEFVHRLHPDVRAAVEDEVLAAAAKGDMGGLIRSMTGYLGARLMDEEA